jgi:hypothetical protein
MVLSSSLKAVKGAMLPEDQPIKTIAEKAGLTVGVVRYCLEDLIDLQLVEKVEGGEPSGIRGGWIRVQYRLVKPK